MVYCETIEESKTWVCPKGGIWKIICIGGGGAGAAHNAIGQSGGTTSFGSILSANGGAVGGATEGFKYINNSASINGYNGAVGYGTQNTTHYTGFGYGASGTGDMTGNSSKNYVGKPGELKSVIVDISEGTSIACTIGFGGEGASATDGNDRAHAGTNGAIIVQYLGESM